MKDESLTVTVTPLWDTDMDLLAVAKEIVSMLKKYPGIVVDARVSNGVTAPGQLR